ncbi:hypothetical protein [Ensifer sp. BR816]|jgi:hypothetical protein|uniref:hypothetical protein n=1 Tax=Rhizobium sp. (strain BR816) TaxID=1057002 RepID=UPI0003782374|nr:hypothetical protein [Ensifer sp. BR816]
MFDVAGEQPRGGERMEVRGSVFAVGADKANLQEAGASARESTAAASDKRLFKQPAA